MLHGSNAEITFFCFLEGLIYKHIYPKHCRGLAQHDCVCGVVYLILAISAEVSSTNFLFQSEEEKYILSGLETSLPGLIL